MEAAAAAVPAVGAVAAPGGAEAAAVVAAGAGVVAAVPVRQRLRMGQLPLTRLLQPWLLWLPLL